VDAGFENQKELTKMQLDNQKEIAEMQNETQKEIAGIQSATSRQNTKDQSVDPNFGRRVRNRRQLNSLQNTWPYGYSMPIAVRYTQDAFSRSGWLWPVDAKGEPLKATSYMAVGFYVAKYVN